jgi:dolichol-phosphate mannosyltransferase
MSVPPGVGAPARSNAGFLTLLQVSLTRLLRTPLAARRAEASRRLLRNGSLLIPIVGIVIVALMYFVDAWEITLMPPRGTPGMWPVGVVTDFGKAAFVLWPLAILLFIVAIVSPGLRGTARALWLRLGVRVQFVFFAVLVPVLFGEVVKWIVGRGRPFVGGKANAFNFSHFAGTEAYASFPSAHAITSASLAFAVAALWPRARIPMIVYAVLVAASRLVLLAHHPSDVVAGALVGVVGAMLVRYWFAIRRLGFRIVPDGAIVPLSGPFKGLPTAHRPHKKRTPQSPDAVLCCGPTQTTSVDLSSSDTEAVTVSIVVPVHNEAGNVAPLIAEITAALDGRWAYEIIYVNDGSIDATAERLAAEMKPRGNLRQIRHAASSGQSAAVRSGVRAARGAIVATLDGDGQNNPAFLPDLILAIEQGGERMGLAAGQRVGRKDTGFKKMQSRIANGVRNGILRDGTRDTGCGLKAFRREVFLMMPYFDGLHRFLPALVRREGYEIAYVDVIDRPRHSGVSNYGFFDRLWIGIMDLAGVWWLIRRKKPTPVATEVISP